jgi:hypothetical protein
MQTQAEFNSLAGICIIKEAQNFADRPLLREKKQECKGEKLTIETRDLNGRCPPASAACPAPPF